MDSTVILQQRLVGALQLVAFLCKVGAFVLFAYSIVLGRRLYHRWRHG